MFNLKEWKEKQKKTLPSRQEVYRNGISENEFLQECITCHQSKPLTEFSSDFGTTSGYSHKCKSCVTAYNHKNRLDNLADRKKYAKEYREKNADKIKKKKREDYINNKEKKKEYNKQYWEKNKDIMTKKHQEWLNTHPEYRSNYNKEYYKNNKDSISKQVRNYARKKRYWLGKELISECI